MHFTAFDQTTVPNIVVDGSRNAHTILTLSHWPGSGTPAELKADTSAEIAFKYLDSPGFHVSCDAVTNNHFDQDGLAGVFVLLDPVTASRYRDRIIDVATAGDFGVFKTRDAARIDFAISTLADREFSPLPKPIFDLRYPAMAAELYVRLLDLFPQLIAAPADFANLWEAEDAKLSASETLIKQGDVSIEELLELDLAVVRLPESLPPGLAHRFVFPEKAECHPMAIYNATPCTRILLIRGRNLEFRYRYESWVQFVSRKPAARVDLAALAVELNSEERSGGQWKFDGVDAITPRLRLTDAHETSIPVTTIRRRLEEHLQIGAAAWNPYDA